MPRRNLIRTNKFPYHVTIRTNNKEWFKIPMNEVFNFAIRSMKIGLDKHPVKIQAFVLMSNHYHLLVWTPESNLDKFMFEFNRNFSSMLRRETGRINRVFGDRYKWSIIDDESYYKRALKYIYQNPVIGNICNQCERYRFSTLFHYVNGISLPFELYQPILDHKGAEFLDWVNEENDIEEDLKTSIALTRPIFKIPSQKTILRRDFKE